MELEKFLRNFSKEECVCQKGHLFTVSHIVVENRAIEKLPEYVAEFKSRKPFLLADKNTFEAAGEKVCRVLEKAGIYYEKYVFSSGDIEPDEKAMGSVFMHFDNSCDLVIGIGSGVINDIGKMLANTAKLPYFIIGTAPSMDGYASATSSMVRDGVKVSLSSKCADVIIGDIDVLKNAPERMLQAGLGDMIAKYIGNAEWKVASEITGEYYCERVAQLVRSALKSCVENAEGLINRDEKAVKAVFEGLVLSGIAMAFVSSSRPASGSEHYFSHIWDMRGLEFGTSVDLHGIQCAIGTNLVAGMYEKVLEIIPDKDKAVAYARSFNYEKWSEFLRKFLGASGEVLIKLEEKEQKYNIEKHKKRIKNILEKWDKICDIIREEIPARKEIERILELIGAPKSAAEIGVNDDIPSVLKVTKDIRDKYILANLLWDLGVIDEFEI